MTRIRGDADVTQLKWNSKSHGYRNVLLYLLTPQRLKNEYLFINIIQKQKIFYILRIESKSIEFRRFEFEIRNKN